METISNKEKAREIAKKLSHPNIDSFGDGDDEFDSRFYHVCKDAALQAMRWKDEQHEQQKQQLIDKAADFISKHFYIGINNHITSNENYYSLTELIRDFEQTMKGE